MSSADETPAAPAGSSIPEDHIGITQLLSILACGELAAFYRLTDEAELAPGVDGRIAMARMASAQMGHFELLAAELVERGVDVRDAVAQYQSTLDQYHQLTVPRTWLESMVKTYIGDGLAADFYREVADVLPTGPSDLVKAAMEQTAHSQFAAAEVRRAVTDNPRLVSPLTLWARRLLGEAITQAQYVLAARDELTDMLFSAGGDLGRMTEFFDSIQSRHDARMSDLGLST